MTCYFVLFILSNAKTAYNRYLVIQKLGKIWLKYRKSTSPNKPTLTMFTKIRQYWVKSAQKYLLWK